MSDTLNTQCVRYELLEPAAKWLYYGTKILKELARRAPPPEPVP